MHSALVKPQNFAKSAKLCATFCRKRAGLKPAPTLSNAMTLFFEFAFLRRIGGARELHAIAVRISKRHNPKPIPDKWTFTRLNSARFELPIEGQRVLALEAHIYSSP